MAGPVLTGFGNNDSSSVSSLSMETGTPTLFYFFEDQAGQFSGHQSVFWTTSTDSDCASPTSSPTAQPGVDATTINSGDGSASATSTLTLLGLQPGTYYLCYDEDGVDATYTGYVRKESFTLTLTGLSVRVCVLL